MITAELDNKVKRVISNIRNLPTPPIVFHQIQKVINNPNVNAGQVASILAEDPAMSVKVLRLTNSAFYGLSKEIESVKQAVVIIGFEAIKNLVLSASVLDMFKGKNIDQEYQDEFWRHSLSTALCCRNLARKVRSRGVVDPDSAFSAGLLHDVGKLIICCFLETEYARYVEERKSDTNSEDFTIEDRLFGYNHAHIGGFLGTQWKIPHKLTEAITFHHNPQLYEGDDPIAHLVYLGNHIAKMAFKDMSDESRAIPDPDPHLMEYLALTPADLENFATSLKEEYFRAETFMQMAGAR